MRQGTAYDGTIFDQVRADSDESLSALIGEACDVGDELVETLDAARAWVGGYGHERAENVAKIDAALAKARRCPDGECTEKCANGGAA
jgi:hypothetical protein